MNAKWIASAALAAGLAAATALSIGGRHTGSAAAIVYVCTETGQVLSAPPQPVPAINPATGRRTLVRGVYCAGCNRWYAAPAPDHRTGNPRPPVCRIHHVAMTFDGPDP